MTEPRQINMDPAVSVAGQWVADNPPRPDIIPHLKAKFSLTSLQAAEACAMAQKFRLQRRAFG
ncbi:MULTISPECIES: hypothetical protein [Rhizobium]|jgi:hypothetical protein|uniref:Uncharacterized protein n=1 Tax=Rhizobium leguminosarum TaxID=384 RepID=A0A4Q8XXY5_RHILE|nr:MULTISPECIES: hypothetical protein [Rhizobium]MDV4156964.1 hypothetical protein [Rhizobium brockwellii]TAX71791.1 hypothetical protein ELI03_08600 [Rhizobium leguminosarum]